MRMPKRTSNGQRNLESRVHRTRRSVVPLLDVRPQLLERTPTVTNGVRQAVPRLAIVASSILRLSWPAHIVSPPGITLAESYHAQLAYLTRCIYHLCQFEPCRRGRFLAHAAKEG